MICGSGRKVWWVRCFAPSGVPKVAMVYLDACGDSSWMALDEVLALGWVVNVDMQRYTAQVAKKKD